jgi:hypothetical protein
LSGLLVTVACGGGGDTSDANDTAGSGQDLTAASSIVGKWALDGKADTDFVVTWWDKLELKADKTFVGNEGGNVCDDAGNCEAGTTADLTGTYTLSTSGDKKTITFKFSDKKLQSDRFTFSVSGSKMTMQLAADKQKGGEFDMKKD